MVGDGEAVEAVLDRRVDEVRDPAEPVEQAELGVGVEVDEVVRGDGHGTTMVPAADPPPATHQHVTRPLATTYRSAMTSRELDRYLQDLTVADAFSGVVRVTVGDDQRFAAAYGFASRAWRVPNTLDTRFDTASTTKLFTAVATLQLVDAGAFGLDTSAVQYLGLEGTAISPDVTVRHLLTHTSGIGDDADEEAGESYEAVWQTRPNYTVLETADFLPQFVHRPPNFAPEPAAATTTVATCCSA